MHYLSALAPSSGDARRDSESTWQAHTVCRLRIVYCGSSIFSARIRLHIILALIEHRYSIFIAYGFSVVSLACVLYLIISRELAPSNGNANESKRQNSQQQKGG